MLLDIGFGSSFAFNSSRGKAILLEHEVLDHNVNQFHPTAAETFD
jgi:hypothetical protein